MLKLVLLFTIVPLVELYLLLTIGEHLGPWPTIGVVLTTGVVGAWLAKREGLRVLRGWQSSLGSAQMPEDGVLDGVLVLVGGVLLVTPGVLTDVVGLSLLVPPSRHFVAKLVRRSLEKRFEAGNIRIVDFSAGGGGPFASQGGPFASRGDVIDGEAEVIDRPPPGADG